MKRYAIYLDVFCDACGHASASHDREGVALCSACVDHLTADDLAALRNELTGGDQ